LVLISLATRSCNSSRRVLFPIKPTLDGNATVLNGPPSFRMATKETFWEVTGLSKTDACAFLRKRWRKKRKEKKNRQICC